MLFQPAFDSFMFVRRVVVADQINFFASGYGLIDHTQKPQPLLMAVLLLTESEDLAIGDIQRSEQGGCAVALVIVRHGGASALLHRQARLRAIQRLDLALLIY